MNRAALISRIVFGLLLVATFAAFFAAQKLKRTDALVYAVQMKKFISPNADGLRDRGYVRFRLKRRDTVTVEVIDRARDVTRTLADDLTLEPGVHRFLWNGRRRADGSRPGAPVPDGAYRVRISLARAGRTFVPDKFFMVDTRAPRLAVRVSGAHTVSMFDRPTRGVAVAYSGLSPARRVEFEVYAVRGGRTEPRPVAAFASRRGAAHGRWDLSVGHFTRRSEPCFGRLRTTGRPRPAPPGGYVIVARGCDTAGNSGSSSRRLPPLRGDAGRRAGVTVRGVEIAPAMEPLQPGRFASFTVNPPPGGYRFGLRRVGGEIVATGNGRRARLSFRVPKTAAGLFVLRVTARKSIAGRRWSAEAPAVIASPRGRGPLLVYPAIAWQARNAVDADGDGFPDDFTTVAAGRTLRMDVTRTLAAGRAPAGFNAREAPLARYLAARSGTFPARVTTDYALALDPAALKSGRMVLFAGDERWISPRLGLALKRFVEGGGRVVFFAPDAFRRTVRLAGGEISGPSERSERDVFGESVAFERTASAPLVAFADQLGLLRGPTGLFTGFESSRSRARASAVLTAAGRRPGSPALVAYRLDRGVVFRVGVAGWQQALIASRGPRGERVPSDANVVFTTERIIAEALR